MPWKTKGDDLKNEIKTVIDKIGSKEELDKLKAKVIHLEQNSGGASKPRNIALDILLSFVTLNSIFNYVINIYIYSIIELLVSCLLVIKKKKTKNFSLLFLIEIT